MYSLCSTNPSRCWTAASPRNTWWTSSRRSKSSVGSRHSSSHWRRKSVTLSATQTDTSRATRKCTKSGHQVSDGSWHCHKFALALVVVALLVRWPLKKKRLMQWKYLLNWVVRNQDPKLKKKWRWRVDCCGYNWDFNLQPFDSRLKIHRSVSKYVFVC